MAIDKRLQVFDAEGNPVDYDILATDVKFQDGEDLPTKLSELEEEIGEGGYTPPPGGIPKTDLAPSVQQTLDDVAEKVDKETGKSLMTEAEHTKLQNLPSNPVQSVTINGTNHTPTNGVVDLGNVQGQKGDKGDTGNVQVDGNGNVLIVNNLEDGGTGAALSAEMGKRLALIAGTYAGAWARSKAVIVPFCWLWTETVGGAAISKPIWHIGNSVFVDAAGGVVGVQASAIPATPTFSETSGSTVGKGTELTITPDTDSALYYKIGNGAWIISDAAVTIEINATCTVTAKCVNNAGSSSEVPCSLTVSGPQTPRFSAKPGTTIDNNNVVSRGGYVVITGEAGGVLHYKVNSGSYIDINSVGGAAPTAEVQITEAKTIMAYNTINGEDSEVVTKPYTMAALAAPSMSPASSQLPAGGGAVEITGPAGASIYYTLDGSTPTDQSTLYDDNQPISVTTNNTTIKAIAKDDYGYSAVTTATYTVPVDHKLQFKIKLTGDNSTEYVPVTGNMAPKYHFTVDWGDGSAVETIGSADSPVAKSNKSVGHQYSGSTGDEFTITLRGTSIPILAFNGGPSTCNTAALSAIVENSLDCDTNFMGGFNGCTGLASVSADALQNNTNPKASFSRTGLTSLPDGLLSHLTKSGVALNDCEAMFYQTAIVFTASQIAELKSAISAVTKFSQMFYGITGSFAFPDDFFDGISADTITSVSTMTHSAGTHVSGDAKKLYDSLLTRVTSSATTSNALSATGLSNKDQVPTAWGGSMS